MTKATVFYSWQSDHPSKTNRGLIQDALERAAKKLRADDSLSVDPVIDRDTQGVAGSPDIHAAILGKLRNCDAAVFDVSFVHAGTRLHPNPNVLIELGFALGTIGWERIILVMNDRHGEVEKLPFDIRGKRVLTYSMSQDEEPASFRNRLSAELEERLRVILTEHPRERAADRAGKAIVAMHEGKPGATALVRDALAPLFAELAVKRPTATPGKAQHEVLVLSYEETVETLTAIAEITAAIVDSRHEQGFELLLQNVEKLAGAQSLQPGGSARAGDFDLQRILVRELVTLLAATCLKAGAWQFLRTLCSHHFSFLFDLREQSGNFSSLLAHVESLRPYEKGKNLVEGLGVGQLLKDRYGNAGLAGVRFNDLREADFFLYEFTELESVEPQGWSRWVPLLFPFGEREGKAISWLRRCKSKSWLAKVVSAMGTDEATFKTRYEERWARVAEMFDRTWWSLRHDMKWILLEPVELAGLLGRAWDSIRLWIK